MSHDVTAIIIGVVKELATEIDPASSGSIEGNTVLFGNGGLFDSMALVSLISDLEEKISDTFGKDLILADDRAMSQKSSPFRTVQTLSDYVATLLGDEA